MCPDHVSGRVSDHVPDHMYPTICVRPYVSDRVGQPPFVNIADCASDLSSFLCSLVSVNRVKPQKLLRVTLAFRCVSRSSFKRFLFVLFTDGATLPLPFDNQRTPHQEDYMRVAFREFDQASPENMCKFDATEPTPGNFSWTDCDLIGNLSSSPHAMNGTCVTPPLATPTGPCALTRPCTLVDRIPLYDKYLGTRTPPHPLDHTHSTTATVKPRPLDQHNLIEHYLQSRSHRLHLTSCDHAFTSCHTHTLDVSLWQ
jgi:hypothetical protein